MNHQSPQEGLERAAEALAKQVHERTERETLKAAEQLRALAGDENDPFAARLLEETLEDFLHLPDYTEALFRRRVARALRPEQRDPDVVVGHTRPVSKNPALPAGSKEKDGDGQ